MPTLELNGAEIYYEDVGSGQETILFTHSLLSSHAMYRGQLNYFKERYRCIAPDFRGQGKSSSPEGTYDLDTLAEDVRQLLSRLGVDSCHYVGLSMGGMVGLRLAIRHPGLMKSFVILDSSMDAEDHPKLPKYRLLMTLARWFGFRLVVGQTIPILFGKTFYQNPENQSTIRRFKDDLVSSDRKGLLKAIEGVIMRPALDEAAVSSIQVPTLVLVGDEDTSTPIDKSERIQQSIPNARLEIIPRAGHLSALEQPRAVNELIEAFITTIA